MLALVQQMGRSRGVYPTFPDEVLAEAAEGAIDEFARILGRGALRARERIRA